MLCRLLKSSSTSHGAYDYITDLMAHSQSSRDIFNSLISSFAHSQGQGVNETGLAWFVRAGYDEVSSDRINEIFSHETVFMTFMPASPEGCDAVRAIMHKNVGCLEPASIDLQHQAAEFSYFLILPMGFAVYVQPFLPSLVQDRIVYCPSWSLPIARTIIPTWLT